MKNEELKALGLNEEQVSAVMELKGKYFGSLEKKYEAAQDDITELNKKLGEANDEIQKFKDLKVEDIQKAADDWKEKYEKEKAQREDDLFHASLESLISNVGGKNPKLIKAGLDLEALRKSKDLTKDGTAAVEAFKAENTYMFDGDGKPESVTVVKPGEKAKTTMTKEEIFNITDTSERLKAIRENQHLFEQ